MHRLVAICGMALMTAAAASDAQSPSPTPREQGMQQGQMMQEGPRDMAPSAQPQQGQGWCDPMCRGIMQKEMERAKWMVPWGIVLGGLATAALALLVVLEVLWLRLWARRLRAEPR